MRLKRIFLLSAVGTLVLAGVVWNAAFSGVRVKVTNRGPDALRSVTVQVTGNAYELGPLAVGESRTVKVLPTSESSVNLQFVDASGSAHRAVVGGYLEAHGYRGRIAVELTDHRITKNEDAVHISYF